MKAKEEVVLTPIQERALKALRERLFAEFELVDLILFGSVVRGEADAESDIDLLVMTPQPLARRARHEITDVVFEVNLRYDTNFSTLVVDRESWTSGVFSVLPLHEEVLREGVVL